MDKTILTQMGLNVERMEEHQRRIAEALAGAGGVHIGITGVCTLDNTGVLPLESLKHLTRSDTNAFETWVKAATASLIPAAGAASRHFKEVYNYVAHSEKMSFSNEAHPGLQEWAHLFEEHTHLKAAQKYRKYLAQRDANAHSVAEEVWRSYCAAKALVATFGELPKALVQTTAEGDDFLDLKIKEQHSTLPCGKNILVVAAGKGKEFQNSLDEKVKRLQVDNNWETTEQSLDLSTLRFEGDGSPLMEKGRYSVVSAGHGELVHVLERISKKHPNLECIHIRNIDNVIGSSSAVRETSLTFLHGFYQIKKTIEFFRMELEKPEEQHNLKGMADHLSSLLKLLPSPLRSEVAKPQNKSSQAMLISLHQVGQILFKWQGPCEIAVLRTCLARPLSVMGMVSRDPSDVGGGPVEAELQGERFKICLETPHASPEDYEKFLGENGALKHFNPAFVFFEIKNLKSNTLYDPRFWMLSKKDYQGKTVYYHETVLYELVGNSARTNVLFVEAPRHIFNPHKSVFDSLNKSRCSYGFER